MTTFIEEVNNGVQLANNEDIAALLRKIVTSQLKEHHTQKNYFNVIDICNPAQAYWSQISPETEKSPELARKLALGKRLQRFASIWFRKLPDFVLEEGKIDGAYVGVPGVRGSVDYRIGDAILELKTKQKIPDNIDDVWNFYPHDLEQLAFYSVLHPSYPKINYLIFMQDAAPHQLKVFKVETKDINQIKNIIKSRIKLLQDAIEKKDPSKLGRCRYFGHCMFSDGKVCNCESMQIIPNEFLAKAINLSEDKDFADKLNKAKSDIPKKSLLSAKEIIAPRKNYIEEVLMEENDWLPDRTSESYKACMEILIRKLNFFVTPSEREFVNGSLQVDRLKPHYNWLKIKDSRNIEGEIIPYTLKVSTIKSVSHADKPHEYQTAELSIISSAYGKSRGLIFIVYPNLKDLIQVFEINFNSGKKILDIIRETIKSIDLAKETKDITKIHPCPSFMNDGGKCSLFKDCNKGKGCK